jgi:hypothetical protein
LKILLSKDTVGNISIKVNNAIANQYDAVIAITGQGNQVNLEGNYKTKDSSFDMDLDIDKLNLKVFKVLHLIILRKAQDS